MNGGLIIVVPFQMAHVLKKILIIMEMMSNHYMPLIQVLVRWNARLMKIVSFGLIIHYQMAEIWIVGWNLVTVSHQWNPIGYLALNTVVIITWLRFTYTYSFGIGISQYIGLADKANVCLIRIVFGIIFKKNFLRLLFWGKEHFSLLQKSKMVINLINYTCWTYFIT